MNKTTILNIFVFVIMLVYVILGNAGKDLGEAFAATLFLIVPFWIVFYKKIKSFNASEKFFIYLSSLLIYTIASGFFDGFFEVLNNSTGDAESLISKSFLTTLFIYYLYLWCTVKQIFKSK